VSICEECAKIQKTCCERNDIRIGLTNGDIERIALFAACEDFYEGKALEEEFRGKYANPSRYDEGEYIYVTCLFDDEGRWNVMKRNENQGCWFITPTGCSLPPEVRPLMCRIYPYDWNDQQEIWINGTYCLASLFTDNEDLAKKVALPPEEAKRLVKLFYEEIMAGKAQGF